MALVLVSLANDSPPAPAKSAQWTTGLTETGAGQPLPSGHPLTDQRAEIEQKVLANLLRINGKRAGKH